MFELFTNFTNFLWGMPLLVVIIVTGFYFTVKTRGFQFKYFGFIITNIFKSNKESKSLDDKKKLTPFQAISIAVGGSVGVSNISGVATAIATGGPGALFWIWFAALLGMIIKMAEVSLAVYYRETGDDGTFRGGPTFYIQKALGAEKGVKFWKPLAVIFGIGIFMTWPITIQNYTISEAIGTTFNIPFIIPSIALVICIYLVTIGGLKKIGVIASYLIPIMCGFYILCGIYILLVNISEVPNTFMLIFKGAFTTQAAAGGFLGATVGKAMRLGFARSVYSNEAGWGTSPMVHATADVDHPIKQGLLGAFEVFADTILVCSITGLVVIITGYWNSGMSGANLTLSAFESVIGYTARVIVALSIFLFGLTTNTGWFAYYMTLLNHAFEDGSKTKKIFTKLFVIGNPLWGFFILVASVYFGGTPEQIWVLADFSSVIPTFINVAVLFMIGGKFIELLKDYKARYMGIGTVDPDFKLFYEDELKSKAQ
ncbi:MULTISPECIES: alanine/glycine:cation symporter family protein [unclassified Sedimentibacter]|uniref:alanine/glycine:cation symporter family protein n=1 Tax=unclassified Sedimentibacter TaxID=2649220 RepID=UPI0027E05391|nr:amino acid carrier protein [Sedimentibacter sp. MB35-C1]WMJ77594.1 amino acid carrier protein [Sedimentibacter sp. MB35-C1]